MKKDKFQFIELELKALGGKMILYRPVGTKELELIRESNYRIFPPRLADQPIFYPVLNEQYATEIASGWNVKYNEDHRGYVTKFKVDDQYCGQFEVHQVGGGAP